MKTLAQAVWDHINAALFLHGGNRSRAARTLGMYRQTLQRMIREHTMRHQREETLRLLEQKLAPKDAPMSPVDDEPTPEQAEKAKKWFQRMYDDGVSIIERLEQQDWDTRRAGNAAIAAFCMTLIGADVSKESGVKLFEQTYEMLMSIKKFNELAEVAKRS